MVLYNLYWYVVKTYTYVQFKFNQIIKNITSYNNIKNNNDDNDKESLLSSVMFVKNGESTYEFEDFSSNYDFYIYEKNNNMKINDNLTNLHILEKVNYNFLACSIEYNNESIIIDNINNYLTDNCILLRNDFIYWYLNNKNLLKKEDTSTDNIEYTVTIIDNEANIFNLNKNEYLILLKNNFETKKLKTKKLKNLNIN